MNIQNVLKAAVLLLSIFSIQISYGVGVQKTLCKGNYVSIANTKKFYWGQTQATFVASKNRKLSDPACIKSICRISSNLKKTSKLSPVVKISYERTKFSPFGKFKKSVSLKYNETVSVSIHGIQTRSARRSRPKFTFSGPYGSQNINLTVTVSCSNEHR